MSVCRQERERARTRACARKKTVDCYIRIQTVVDQRCRDNKINSKLLEKSNNVRKIRHIKMEYTQRAQIMHIIEFYLNF